MGTGQGRIEIIHAVHHQAVLARQFGSLLLVRIASLTGRRIEVEEQGGRASFEVLEDSAVGGGQIGVGVFGPQVPTVHHGPQRLSAANVRSEARKSERIVSADRIATTVKRLDIDPFVGVRDQFSLEGGSLQGFLDQGPPSIIGDRRKITADREFVGECLRHASLGIP